MNHGTHPRHGRRATDCSVFPLLEAIAETMEPACCQADPTPCPPPNSLAHPCGTVAHPIPQLPSGIGRKEDTCQRSCDRPDPKAKPTHHGFPLFSPRARRAS